jgi:hypothetical protein
MRMWKMQSATGNSPNANSFLGWISDQGEECGDYPVSEAGGNLTEVFREVELTDNSGTVPVQFMYSNAAHGPEGPIAQANPPVNSLQRSVLPSLFGLRSEGVRSWTAPELSCARHSSLINIFSCR